VLQFEKAVIPGEANYVGRDPWFDGLTTLSEAEGESRKIKKKSNHSGSPAAFGGG
jgi:hypothetical protein